MRLKKLFFRLTNFELELKEIVLLTTSMVMPSSKQSLIKAAETCIVIPQFHLVKPIANTYTWIIS